MLEGMSKELVITEGEYDAMAVYQATGERMGGIREIREFNREFSWDLVKYITIFYRGFQ